MCLPFQFEEMEGALQAGLVRTLNEMIDQTERSETFKTYCGQDPEYVSGTRIHYKSFHSSNTVILLQGVRRCSDRRVVNIGLP